MGKNFMVFVLLLSILLILIEIKPLTKECITELDTEYVVESDGGEIVTARHIASEAVELVIIRYKTEVEIYQCGSSL